jgi:hypothetical protein
MFGVDDGFTFNHTFTYHSCDSALLATVYQSYDEYASPSHVYTLSNDNDAWWQ